MASAKVDYVLGMKDNTNFGSISKRVQEAARGFDGLKNQIELSSRSMAVLQRELVSMQTQYGQNSARIKDLTSALSLNSAAVDKDEKAEAKLRAELEKLVATNEKLGSSIERKSVSVERSKASLEKMASAAGETSRSLANSAKQADSGGNTLNKLKSEALGLASAYFGLEGAAQVAAFAFDGFKIGAGIEQARFTVQTLAKDVEKGNKVFDAAIAFGQQYGYTQEEMARSVAQASTLIMGSTQEVEKSLEVISRLAAVNPAEGFEGAVFAIKELASGDYASIADRFNMGKDAARALRDEIASGVDPIVALDRALAQMGFTNEVLANRMKGSNGALLEMQLAVENTKLAAGGFFDAINAPELMGRFADGLNSLSLGIKTLFGDTEALTEALVALQARGLALENYDEYVRKMTEAGLADEMLSEEAYNAGVALTSKGVAADQASAGITRLNDTEAVLRDMLFQNVQAGELTEEGLSAIIERALELAAANPDLADTIHDNITAMNDERASAEEVTQYLDELSAMVSFTTGITEGLTDAQTANTDAQNNATAAAELAATAIQYNADSVFDLTTAELENAQTKLEQAAAAERAAQFEQDLAFAVDMSNSSAIGAAQGALYLSDAYGIEFSEALRLIDATNALNDARAGRQGQFSGRNVAAALSGAVNYTEGRRSGRISAPAPERSKGRSRSGGGGGKGGGAGDKSEAVKAKEKEQKDLDKLSGKIEDELRDHQEAVRDLETEHAKKLMQIELDYIAKSLKAVQDFNVNKFNIRNNFKQQLFTIDEDLYQSAIKSEKEYWDESQLMAQAGEGEKAARYYEAAQELVNLKAQNAQELRDLEASIASEEDEAARARLQRELERKQEAYTEEERLAAENLAKIKEGQDENKTDRQEAISEENADYQNAKKELDEKFVDSINKIVEGYDAVDEATGRTKDAITAMADAIIAQIGRVAGAAGSVPAGDAPAPEQRALGGYVHRGMPYEVGEHGRELFVPNQSGTIIPRSRLGSYTEARTDSPRNSSIGSVDVNLNIGLTGPASEVNRATGAIRDVIRSEVKKQIGDAIVRINTRKANG